MQKLHGEQNLKIWIYYITLHLDDLLSCSTLILARRILFYGCW